MVSIGMCQTISPRCNRTIIELKQRNIDHSAIGIYSCNRTIIELKHAKEGREHNSGSTCCNRTIIELKLPTLGCAEWLSEVVIVL